jgi:hypothetical protein
MKIRDHDIVDVVDIRHEVSTAMRPLLVRSQAGFRGIMGHHEFSAASWG